MRKYIFILVPFLLTLLFFSSCKKKTPEATMEYKFVVESRDSIQVVQLLDQYMSMVRDGDYEGAASMLRWVEKDNKVLEPLPLNKKRREAAITTMELFPIKKYKIENVIYDNYYNNEAAVRVWFGDGSQSTVWYFKPVRLIETWYLCLRDSRDGDNSLH